jgi:hypothetical protein
MGLMTLRKLSFKLRNALHASTCWENDGASLTARNFITFFANLLSSLKPLFTLRAWLTVEDQAT